MTVSLYLLQVALVGGLLSLLLRNSHWALRLQVLIWTIATVAIVIRYGLIEQLNFYSNDQRYHTEVVQTFTQRLSDVDFLVTGSRLPFTTPAFALYAFGLHPSLALKTVSLICLLLLTSNLQQLFDYAVKIRQAFILFITGCGAIGLFYSVLALRETMMMLFVTRLLLTRSPVERALLLLCTYLLRPHLAISLVVALALAWIWRRSRSDKQETPLTISFMMICGIFIGYLSFSLGSSVLQGATDSVGHKWGIEPVTRIASNYLGLQFLTARSETVEFSIQSLLLLRILLSETVLIPALFTFLVFSKSPKLHTPHITALIAFSIYVSIVTNTDFNSFRQNIPFMPAMGLTVLYLLRSPGPSASDTETRRASNYAFAPLTHS